MRVCLRSLASFSGGGNEMNEGGSDVEDWQVSVKGRRGRMRRKENDTGFYLR